MSSHTIADANALQRQHTATDSHRSQDELLSFRSLVGRKWHLVIIAELLRSPAGFNGLKHRIDGISGKVLSENLQDLEEKGIIDRQVLSDQPFRVEYSLTERGQSLSPIIAAVHDSGIELH